MAVYQPEGLFAERVEGLGLFKRMLKYAAGPILAAYVGAACGGKGDPVGYTPPVANPTPTASSSPASGTARVYGDIKDRINGSPINGSEIEYRGPLSAASAQSRRGFTGVIEILHNADGTTEYSVNGSDPDQLETATPQVRAASAADAKALATVVNGSYEIKDLPYGFYDVSVKGPGHVEHKAMRVSVNSNNQLIPFSVLGWNSEMFGARYDTTFNEFFEWYARARSVPSLNGIVRKWEQMPSAIYVNTEGLSQPAAESFMGLLRQLNDDGRIAETFCNQIGSIQIIPDSSTGYKDGAYIINFGGSSATARRYVNGVITAVNITLNKSRHENLDASNTSARVYDLLHESDHGAGGDHDFDNTRPPIYSDSIQSPSLVNRLSRQDRLAACIVYNGDTRPGNTSPDTNPPLR